MWMIGPLVLSGTFVLCPYRVATIQNIMCTVLNCVLTRTIQKDNYRQAYKNDVEHACFTQIKLFGSSGKNQPWSLHWKVVTLNTMFKCYAIHCNDWGWIWIFSRQGSRIGASHRRAVVCEQLAQGCYLRVQWSGIEPTTSRSLGLTR